MKKIIVMGVGFIGGHVIELLLEKGYEVSILDRYPKKDKDWFKEVRLFLGDIRDRGLVKEAIIQQDGVLNLTGILGTMETVDDPFPSIDTNIIGALNVFEACKPCRSNLDGVKAVQISVGNYFMNNTYAITKNAAEKFAFMYNKEMNTKISIVRALNAYGENQKHYPVRKMIPNFIMSALKRQPINVYGDGEQIMDMIYVKDVARILIHSLTLEHNCYDTVFEAGTGRRTTVNQIACLINELAKNDAGIKYVPMRAGEPEKSIVLGDPQTLTPLNIDINDLTKLEDGISLTLEWYKKYYFVK